MATVMILTLVVAFLSSSRGFRKDFGNWLVVFCKMIQKENYLDIWPFLSYPPRYHASVLYIFCFGLFISFIAEDLEEAKSTLGLYIQAAVDVQSSEVKSELSSLADLTAGVPANQVRVVTPGLSPSQNCLTRNSSLVLSTRNHWC